MARGRRRRAPPVGGPADAVKAHERCLAKVRVLGLGRREHGDAESTGGRDGRDSGERGHCGECRCDLGGGRRRGESESGEKCPRVMRVGGVCAHPSVPRREESRFRREGPGLPGVQTEPAFARVGDGDTIGVDIGRATSCEERRRRIRCRDGRDSECEDGRACRTQGIAVAHGPTLRRDAWGAEDGPTEIRGIPGFTPATRPGCGPDLPKCQNPRNLLLVRPTGKSEKAGRPRPLKRRTTSNPNSS